jgi:hypothetical protein
MLSLVVLSSVDKYRHPATSCIPIAAGQNGSSAIHAARGLGTAFVLEGILELNRGRFTV